jgi:hypothetical protein
MFSLMLEYKIWAEHRPQAESVRHSTRLVNDLDAIEARENKQGSCFPIVLILTTVTHLQQLVLHHLAIFLQDLCFNSYLGSS